MLFRSIGARNAQHKFLLTEEQVGIETAFMRFVNDDATVLGEQEVLLQLPQQDTIRHELQSRLLTQPAIIPYLYMQTNAELHYNRP